MLPDRAPELPCDEGAPDVATSRVWKLHIFVVQPAFGRVAAPQAERRTPTGRPRSSYTGVPRRIASEMEARRGTILAAFNTLDKPVALADDTATGERTHHHRTALAEPARGPTRSAR